MADKPMFQAASGHFQMKLQGEEVGTEAECLVRAEIGGGEVFGPLRQVESIAMPMQYLGQIRCQMTDRAGGTGFC